jgi:hypothetical protein
MTRVIIPFSLWDTKDSIVTNIHDSYMELLPDRLVRVVEYDGREEVTVNGVDRWDDMKQVGERSIPHEDVCSLDLRTTFNEGAEKWMWAVVIGVTDGSTCNVYFDLDDEKSARYMQQSILDWMFVEGEWAIKLNRWQRFLVSLLK